MCCDMDAIKPNPILKFNKNHLQNVRKTLGYENVNKLKQDIEHFQEWIQKQSHFRIKEFDLADYLLFHGATAIRSPQPIGIAILYDNTSVRIFEDAEYLERLLIYNKGSIERAKQKFDKLCTCTNLMPEYLQNFDIKNEFAALFKVSDTCILPTPTEDNYRVLIIVANGEDDEKYELIQFYRYLIVLGHYLLTHDYCQGFEVVGDMRKITLNSAKKFNPLVIHKALILLTECMGQRMKKIHLFSGSKFFDMILYLLKQGLSSKLKERIVVHSNVESLSDHIPRDRLPEDYGGDCLSVKELAEQNFKELSSEEHIAKVKFMEQTSTDESCRLPCTFNEEYFGLPGSFKTLCVD